MPGGERGNWQGEIFHRYCKQLCLALAYEEVFERENSIDWAGRPVNLMGRLRPLFSPDGFTLFEFTSESDGPQARIQRHVQTVNEFNENQELTDIYGVASGGVVAIEWRVADNLISEALEEDVYVWDYRVLSFYSEITQLMKMWKTQGMTAYHEPISETTSFMHAFLPGSRSEIRLLLLQEDILTQLNKNTTRTMLNAAVTSLRDRYFALKPLYVDVHVFCLGDFSPDLISEGREVGFKAELLRTSLEEINFRVPERPNSEFITCYRIGPWSSGFTTFGLVAGERS